MRLHPIVKTSFLFGLAGGLVSFSYFLLLYARGADALGNLKMLDLISSSLLFVIVSIWYYRRMVRKGFLHLWEGLAVGFLTNLIGAVLSASCVALFISFVDPAILTSHIAALERLLLDNKAVYVKQGGEQGYAAQLKNLVTITAGTMFWDELIRKVFLIGIFPVFITSIFLRKQEYSIFTPEGTVTGSVPGKADNRLMPTSVEKDKKSL